MNSSKYKGDNHVWLVTVFLGCWLAFGVACPVYCRCVTSLYVYCDQQNITDDEFGSVIDSSPTEATFIDLSQNHLTTFPERAFSKFTEMMFIDASNNEIQFIPEKVFDDLPLIQKISLSDNNITTLHNRTFQLLPDLQEVNLQNNRINFIDVCAFTDTPSLEILNLSGNNLSSVLECVNSLTSLVSLDISYNEITAFSNAAFSNLVNLKALYAAHNSISSLTSVSFQGLSELETLKLDGNDIQELYGDFFIPFRKKLKHLSMNFNRIRVLRSNLFSGMLYLDKVDLSYNDINYLGTNIVPGLSLSEFNLQGNKLEEITRTAFGLTRKITELDLSFNEIKSIASSAFSSFSESVYRINLKSNQLTQVLVGMFDGMGYLQSLDLANNSIRFIEDGAFRDLENLNYLDLSYNELMLISPQMFTGVLTLKTLHLHYNPVRRFEWPDFSVHKSNFVINLNLSFENVTHSSVRVKWPYTAGSQIYWSQYVSCIQAQHCPFRTQAEYLAPNSKEVTISNVSPSSTYYVCVNPEFKIPNIKVQQCGVVTTPKVVQIITTEQVAVTEVVPSNAIFLTPLLFSPILALLVLARSVL